MIRRAFIVVDHSTIWDKASNFNKQVGHQSDFRLLLFNKCYESFLEMFENNMYTFLKVGSVVDVNSRCRGGHEEQTYQQAKGTAHHPSEEACTQIILSKRQRSNDAAAPHDCTHTDTHMHAYVYVEYLYTTCTQAHTNTHTHEHVSTFTSPWDNRTDWLGVKP